MVYYWLWPKSVITPQCIDSADNHPTSSSSEKFLMGFCANPTTGPTRIGRSRPVPPCGCANVFNVFSINSTFEKTGLHESEFPPKLLSQCTKTPLQCNHQPPYFARWSYDVVDVKSISVNPRAVLERNRDFFLSSGVFGLVIIQCASFSVIPVSS